MPMSMRVRHFTPYRTMRKTVLVRAAIVTMVTIMATTTGATTMTAGAPPTHMRRRPSHVERLRAAVENVQIDTTGG